MLASSELASQKVENPLSIVEASAGVSHTKGGKGIGDLVDVKTIEAWVGEYRGNRTDNNQIDEKQLFVAFQYGVRAEGRFAGQSFVEAEPEIRAEWSSERGQLPWDSVRDAVWAGFDRARDRKL
jgi:hypothetical protein